MLVPLIRTLQTYLPDATLTWVISRPAYDLVEGMEKVEFVVIDKPNNAADYWRFRHQMKTRSFDVLLATQSSFRANLLYPFIKAKRKIGFDAHRSKDGHAWFIKETIEPGHDHTLESFLKFATVLGVKQPEICWDLPKALADEQWATAHVPKQKPMLVVNPAASKPERSWPVERYIELLQKAQALWGLTIVLVGGPGAFDKQLGEQIEVALPVTNLIGKTKPKQLLAVIRQAQAVLCPDTGPSHMATAVGTPVVALHAVTNPFVSGPYTSQHLVVNRFPDAVKQVLGLSYEEHSWGTHVHGPEAMQLITIEEVLAQLANVFGSKEGLCLDLEEMAE